MSFTKRDQVGPPKDRRRKRLGESDAGREERLRWQQERDAYRAAHPLCEFGARVDDFWGWDVECYGPRDVHHIQPRGMGGKRGATGPLVTLCRMHHDLVERERIEAREHGLLIRRMPA